MTRAIWPHMYYGAVFLSKFCAQMKGKKLSKTRFYSSVMHGWRLDKYAKCVWKRNKKIKQHILCGFLGLIQLVARSQTGPPMKNCLISPNGRAKGKRLFLCSNQRLFKKQPQKIRTIQRKDSTIWIMFLSRTDNQAKSVRASKSNKNHGLNLNFVCVNEKHFCSFRSLSQLRMVNIPEISAEVCFYEKFILQPQVYARFDFKKKNIQRFS